MSQNVSLFGHMFRIVSKSNITFRWFHYFPPRSTFLSLPLSTLFFLGKINVYIFRCLGRHGCIITPQLLLSQELRHSGHALCVVTCWFEFSKSSALSHFLLKEHVPIRSNCCSYSNVPCAVCGSFLFLPNATDSFPPLQGCAMVKLQIPAVSRFSKVACFMCMYTRAPISLYKVSERYSFYSSNLFLWHLLQMVVIV